MLSVRTTEVGAARPGLQGKDVAVLVLPVGEQQDLDQPIVCDWREGDVW